MSLQNHDETSTGKRLTWIEKLSRKPTEGQSAPLGDSFGLPTFRSNDFARVLREHGQMIEIIGVILARTGCDLKQHRAIIDALIGIGKNKFNWLRGKAEWFDASREAIVDQIKPFDHEADEKKKASELQKVSRMIGALRTNQDHSRVLWVEYQPGGMKSGKRYSSRFRLAILEYAVEAYRRAFIYPERYESKDGVKRSKWKLAAIEVADELLAKRVIH